MSFRFIALLLVVFLAGPVIGRGLEAQGAGQSKHMANTWPPGEQLSLAAQPGFI